MTADRRWATFDCYGTLIDWNGGLRDALGRIFGQSEGTRMLDRYHAVEPLVQAEDSSLGYREVMAEVLARLAREEGLDLPLEERDALGRSLPSWPVFGEVPEALTAARRRGWRLAILSNTDRDFIDASMERIGVPFELAIVASEIGSYKPARGHWDAFFDRTGADPSLHVHVGASLYHDIRPAGKLGMRSIWINRLGEEADVAPARELPDLSRLAETLDELVRRPG
jgi:2-haloacid dehalogenase